MMKKYTLRFLTAALCLFACSIVLVSSVTAGACDQPGNPSAVSQYERIYEASDATILVEFHDDSTAPPGQPISSYSWDFGDGDTTTEKDPRHTFAEGGSKVITHKVTTICGKSDTTSRTITLYCNRPIPRFTVDKSEGFAPLTVHITDTSEKTPVSVTTWEYWRIKGHGENKVSTEKNPQITFTEEGVYTIRQDVKKSCNLMKESFSLQINVSKPVLFPYVILNATTFSNTPTTPVPTTTARPLALQTSYALVTTTRTATVSQTPVTMLTSGTLQSVPVVAGTLGVTGTTAAPGTGTLSVITDPAGAKVFVDDVLRGASPATVPGLQAGSHTLRLEKEGYRNLTVPVEINDGKTTSFSTALVPESGGMGMLPLIIGAVVILVLAGIGGYLYMQKKKAP